MNALISAALAMASGGLSFADASALQAWFSPATGPAVIVSAHRGGPRPGFPENALETFARSMEDGPMLLECDVRESADGRLVLMHDDTLDRTTTGRGKVAEETFEAMRTLRLRDNDGRRTSYSIPSLREALAWSEGRAVLALDVKRGISFEKVVAEIQAQRAQSRVQVIVYNNADLMTVRRLDPTLCISASASSLEQVAELKALNLPPAQISVFTGVGRIRPDVIFAIRALGMRAAMGTFGDIDDRANRFGPSAFDPALSAGISVLATDSPWQAARVKPPVNAQLF
jgi:glycerophosphoryl diester phosphodiesterase